MTRTSPVFGHAASAEDDKPTNKTARVTTRAQPATTRFRMTCSRAWNPLADHWSHNAAPYYLPRIITAASWRRATHREWRLVELKPRRFRERLSANAADTRPI